MKDERDRELHRCLLDQAPPSPRPIHASINEPAGAPRVESIAAIRRADQLELAHLRPCPFRESVPRVVAGGWARLGDDSPRLDAIRALMTALVMGLRSRSNLVVENMALRQQLAVLRHSRRVGGCGLATGGSGCCWAEHGVDGARCWWLLEVEAKDEAARAFYRKHGAVSLLDDEDHLVFVLRTFRALKTS